MVEHIQALIGHDAVGAGIFLALIGYAIALNLPREWHTASGWAAATTAAPLALGAAAALSTPWLLMPALFIAGIACAGRR